MVLVENKIKLYRAGMKDLVEVVTQDTSVHAISATSHLVHEHARLFKRMGFDIKDVPKEERPSFFRHDNREIKAATISREEFLKGLQYKKQG